jgi:uncharacterized protein
MLELRPNCELCDRDLPPTSQDARICSYECTYCADCVEAILHNVCPTCGGGFSARPIRPKRAYRSELKLGLEHNPACEKRTYSKFTSSDIDSFVAAIRATDPAER